MPETENYKDSITKLLDLSPLPTIQANNQGQIIYINQPFIDMFGYQKYELPNLETGIFELIPDDSHCQQIHNFIARNIGPKIHPNISVKNKSGQILQTEIRLHKDDKNIFIIFQINPKSKKKIGYQRSNDLNLAIAAHEIKTPLNSLISLVELINAKTNAKYKKYFDAIIANGNTLSAIIHNILTPLQDGKTLKTSPEKFNIHNCIKELYNLFSLKSKEIRLHYRIDDMLPEFLLSNELKLRQIIMNLLNISMRYTEKGSISIHANIHFIKGSHPNGLQIIIEDTGTSIPQNEIEKLSNPIPLVNKPIDQLNGETGFSLAISKIITKQLGGELVITTTEENGNCFVLKFPQLQFSSSKPDHTSISQKPIPDLYFQPATILIVDDVEANRLLIQKILEKFSLHLIFAQNGKEAIEKTYQYKPELIFMDILMPIMSGDEAIKQIKSDRKISNIPIIVISASFQHYQMATQLQCEGMLLKPVNINDLLFVLKRFLRTN